MPYLAICTPIVSFLSSTLVVYEVSQPFDSDPGAVHYPDLDCH
jgi:hypothetical protein